ncbi:MAG TPA: hypothetical protein VG755_01545 [Nannocystaceae bacterium]|nr:hypothetical protein [Nannocystaceae bacterium]
MIPRAPIVLLLAAAAIAAIALPLATYAITLACFGLAHAIVELRIIDARYRDRLRGLQPFVVGLGLATIFGVRIAGNLQVLPRATQHAVELAIAAALVLALLPTVWRAGRARGALAVIVALALLLGLAISPMHALLVAAVLHNLAPWPLVLDALPHAARRRASLACAIVFVAIPLAIATGVPWRAMHALGLVAPEAMLLDIGPLDEHMKAFLPAGWLDPMAALHAFSACAYLQCAHYVGVLLVLPRTDRARVPQRWITATVLVGAALALAYALDFANARAWYGTIAGVHAWAEFPALLLVLAAPAIARAAPSRS